MTIRLRYAALLAAALITMYVGLWPSLLTVGALVAIPVAAAALLGVLHPSSIERRAWLRAIVRWGGTLVVLELVILGAWTAWTPRRPVHLIVTQPIPQRVRVVYSVADGAPRRWWNWARQFDVPPRGVIYTRYADDHGWFRPGNPHPLRVVARGPEGRMEPVPGAWVAGGTTQAGTCTLTYDDFLVGPNSYPQNGPDGPAGGSGWLDSLDTWGVTCRHGNLYRAAPGAPVTLERTGAACYYGSSGGMTCGSDPTAR